MKRSRIIGTGSYLPEKILTNLELEQMVNTSDEWIRERTGIKQRHIADPKQTTGDLAFIAAQHALAMAAIKYDELDLIIVATTTPDQVYPSTACLLQKRLSIKNCPAFDIQAACTGFIYALSIADQFIRSGSVKRALVVGADVYSRILNWNDRKSCVLFGDGAGAVVLTTDEAPGIFSTHLHADGNYKDLLNVPWGVGQGYDQLNEINGFTLMQGSDVFRHAVKMLTAVATEAFNANNMQLNEINWLIPHQANIRIIEATAKKLNLPMEQIILTVDQHGNTSAASIPLALDVAVRDGRIQKNDILLLEAFGAGFTWGSALIRY